MRNSARGQSRVELLLAVVIVALAAAVAVPLYRGAVAGRDRVAVSRAAHEVYRALLRYENDHGAFPSPSSSDASALDRVSLAPLAGDYLHDPAAVVAALAEGGLLTYDASAAGEPRFWATLASARRPEYVLLIAHTDELPLDRGDVYDGVYVVSADGLSKVESRR